ncbi:PD-(D/E)XK nuclease family protein [Actinomyces sp. B33]|uniref:RecB family exonuclease n=1 Tax=Actinomyces sp. B33 TaxID=2942131 RepID=UPI002341E1F0|nr:PD-(D/E)XK nuclease family protein [Actinomyces sp. B33]MDC4233357.1 PD-(D/E)XK nuclease family protein [Actinomyces sp. B33]
MTAPSPAPSRLPALSASRAKEYQRCPLQYRLHVVDRIVEPATRATAMGTLIHSVLEDLFDFPAVERTDERAQEILGSRWEQMSQDPGVASLFEDDSDRASWLASTREVLAGYFRVEDPTRLEPAAREERIEAVTPEGVRLRGFVDRIDAAPTGALRVVDYKTGKAPSPRFQDEALFQMRFYALLLQLTRALPARTQLLYLKAGQVLTMDPRADDIDRFRQRIVDLWGSIEADARRGEFPPRRNPLCNWCGVRALCPLFEGTPPPLDERRIEWLLSTRVA